jgi:hypothetical protein
VEREGKGKSPAVNEYPKTLGLSEKVMEPRKFENGRQNACAFGMFSNKNRNKRGCEGPVEALEAGDDGGGTELGDEADQPQMSGERVVLEGEEPPPATSGSDHTYQATGGGGDEEQSRESAKTTGRFGQPRIGAELVVERESGEERTMPRTKKRHVLGLAEGATVDETRCEGVTDDQTAVCEGEGTQNPMAVVMNQLLNSGDVLHSISMASAAGTVTHSGKVSKSDVAVVSVSRAGVRIANKLRE